MGHKNSATNTEITNQTTGNKKLKNQNPKVF